MSHSTEYTGRDIDMARKVKKFFEEHVTCFYIRDQGHYMPAEEMDHTDKYDVCVEGDFNVLDLVRAISDG